VSKSAVLILAAGKGTRLKSQLPKVLHRAGGKTLLGHVIDAARGAGVAAEDIYVVAGYAADRIRVNSIHPGFIETPMVDRFVHDVPAEEQVVRQQIAALHPLGHIGEPDDIGWAIVYLASDEAKFITGTELVIDGGYTAR